ncbi:MAG: hypothetical protein JWP14_558 [Frankiales bacterium]|nr:hypothetical protein [Frankiales bacterium]
MMPDPELSGVGSTRWSASVRCDVPDGSGTLGNAACARSAAPSQPSEGLPCCRSRRRDVEPFTQRSVEEQGCREAAVQNVAGSADGARDGPNRRGARRR